MWSIILAVSHTQLTMCTVYCGRRITAKFYNKITGAHWTWLLLLWLVANMYLQYCMKHAIKTHYLPTFLPHNTNKFSASFKRVSVQSFMFRFLSLSQIIVSQKTLMLWDFVFFYFNICWVLFTSFMFYSTSVFCFGFLQHFCACQCCLRL